MKFIEKDLQHIIYSQLRDGNYELISELGLELYCFGRTRVFKELHIGNYGYADIVSISIFKNNNRETEIYIDIIELKRDKVNEKTLIQAARYYKGVKEYMSLRGINNFEIRLHLIGSRVDLVGDWVYLFDLFAGNGTEVNAYEFEYAFDGLKIKEIHLSGYKLINEGFKL